MTDALILVDIQRDFLPGGALAVPAGNEVIPVALSLAAKFDVVVTTQDWHPQDHCSFAVNHSDREIGDLVTIAEREQKLWPVHCVANTAGAALAEPLAQLDVSLAVKKGQDPQADSYSGFFDDNGQTTGLVEWLRSRGIARVFVLGLATEYCVRATAHDAVRLGFATFVVQDGCRGVNAESSAQTWRELQAAGARLITADQVDHVRKSSTR